MKMHTGIMALLIFCLSCNEQSVDTKAEGEKLMQISREWSKAASTDSVEKILSYWADDAVVMSPDHLPMKGKAEIRAMIEGAAKIPGFRISWEPLSVYVSKSGDLAYLIEENQMTMNDSTGKPVTQHNKAVTIWRKQADGTWKNVVDMWNANPKENSMMEIPKK
jgi:ketosteroid isomerase-like protein